MTLSPEPTDLADLIGSTVELMRPQADAKGVRLEASALADVGAVLVDPSRVRQVAINLVGNAIKFTQAGAVSVSLSEAGDGSLTVAVRDSGVGIPADRLDHIFERFAQADGSTSRRFGGTGLGLTICKLIVNAMGGDLAVESAVGVGSTFSFTINPARVQAAALETRPSTSPSSSLAGLRVLVADDNPFNQELFVALMEGCGLDITLASNGAEAVEAVQEAAFDLVLMDMQMPVMDGLEATRAIRSLGLADLPVVALTANVVPSQIELCLAAGMNDHLSKPYTAEDARAMMARWTVERAGAPPVADQALWTSLSRTIGDAALDGLLQKLATQLRATAHLMRDGEADPVELRQEALAAAEASATLGLPEVADSYRVLLELWRSGGDASTGVEHAARATDAATRRIQHRLSGRG